MDNKYIFEYDIEEGVTIMPINSNNSFNSNCSKEIIISYSNDKQTSLHVNTNDTIRQIKEKCGEVDRCWGFNANILKNNKCISDYHIENGDVIFSSSKNSF